MRLVASALAFLLATCAPAPSSDQVATERRYKELRSFVSTPEYGAARRMQGTLSLSFETSAFDLCDEGPGNCQRRRNVDGSPQSCWAAFTPGSGSNAILARDGQYWIEFTGKIAVRPGMFGHLNRYTCQVEIGRIHSIRTARIDAVERRWVLGPELAR